MTVLRQGQTILPAGGMRSVETRGKGQTELKNSSASLRHTESCLTGTPNELHFVFHCLTFTRGKRSISNEAKGQDEPGVYFPIA